MLCLKMGITLYPGLLWMMLMVEDLLPGIYGSSKAASVSHGSSADERRRRLGSKETYKSDFRWNRAE